MTRKITTFILTVLIMLSIFPITALADTPQFDASSFSKTDTILLIDAKSGNVLFEKNAAEKIYPASTTKILTCIIAIEQNSDLNAEFTAGTPITGSLVRGEGNCLIQGEKIKLNDLLYGLMLPSGNDAAKTIALNMGGMSESVEESAALNNFGDIMNQKAKELGMENSFFLSPSGRHDPENPNYTTAKDMAKLTTYAMKNELFRKIVSTVNYTFPSTNKYNKATELANTNSLIKAKDKNGNDNPYYNQYAIGIKTGDTTPAGRCLVAAAKKDDMELIALIFGDRTDSGNERWTIANKLFEFGFGNFVPIDITETISKIEISSINIANASLNDSFEGNLELTPAADENGRHTITGTSELEQIFSSNSEQITARINTKPDLAAPIDKGQICGDVEYLYNGEVVYKADLISPRDVAATFEGESPPVVTPQSPIPTKDIEVNEKFSPWLWLIIPAILVLALLTRWFLIKNRKKSRFKKRRRYRYNIRK